MENNKIKKIIIETLKCALDIFENTEVDLKKIKEASDNKDLYNFVDFLVDDEIDGGYRKAIKHNLVQLYNEYLSVIEIGGIIDEFLNL